MAKAIWSIIGIIILFHFYLFMRYEIYTPCGAAFARIVEARPKLSDEAKVALEYELGWNTRMMHCYRIVLTGHLPSKIEAELTKAEAESAKVEKGK